MKKLKLSRSRRFAIGVALETKTFMSANRREQANADEAIYFENLLLRVTGNGYFQRTGEDHDQNNKLSNPSQLPNFR